MKNEDLTPSRKIENEKDAKKIVVIGVPYDLNSTFMKGTAKAPPEIRKALNSGSTNMCTENGIDLATLENFLDLGDLDLENETDVLKKIERVIRERLVKGERIVSMT